MSLFRFNRSIITSCQAVFKQPSLIHNNVGLKTNNPMFYHQNVIINKRYASTNSKVNHKRLADRVAIVTGSTEGIGYSIAKRLAEDGAKVVISSRKKDKVEKATSELVNIFPNQVKGIVCHVGNEDDRNRLVSFTLEQFGSIDILVSNVAVNPYFGSFLEMEESQWDKIFDVNVKAPFLLTKLIVPHMMKNIRKEKSDDKGSIVYISSISGYTGLSSIGAYSVSKTALLGLCKNMSSELAKDNIRVNCVAPGVIKTKFSSLLWNTEGGDDYFKSLIHMKRLGEPDEVSGLVSFLSGPEASYITGENITVSGGYHCSL